LRIRNGEFDVSFDRGTLPPLVLGKTIVADQIVPAKKGDQAGAAAMELTIFLGPRSEETMDRLLTVYNIIGDPISNLKMVVKGKAEVGLQLPRGWVFEPGRKFEVELVFTPAVQREILLK
jgi:hypothetical protein